MDRKKPFFRINTRIDQNMVLRFASFLERVKLNPLIDGEFMYLIFDSPGGRYDSAVIMTDMMRASGFRFFAIAMERVHSSAIPIYLSCHAWYCYGKATALVHRAVPEKGSSVSVSQIKKAEKQVFSALAKRLLLPLREVYSMADRSMVIEANTQLGRTFFLGLDKPSAK